MSRREVVSDWVGDARSLLRPRGRRLLRAAFAYGNDVLEAAGRSPRYTEYLDAQWRRILGRSSETLASLPAAGSPRVLFASVWGLINAGPAIESTIAMALRMRGATPIVLACDKALPACEWNPFGNGDPPAEEYGPRVTDRTRTERCRICVDDIRASHGLPGLDWVTFSEVAEPGDLARAEAEVDRLEPSQYREHVYRGIHVGDHAFSSLMRVMLRGTLEDTPRARFLLRRYLVAAILVVDYGNRVFDRVRPDRLVTFHGIYVTQGTLTELARQRGIHPIVFGTPYRMGTIWLSHDDTYHRTLITHPNKRWQSLEMTPERVRIADEYLESKHVVPRDYASYHVNAEQDEAVIRRELRLGDAPIVSLFTNVLWDAQLYYRFNAFPNMLDWAFETIRYFAGRPDLQLVLRLHPAEARGAMPTNQPLAPEIQREFPTLPANVRVIEPESTVSSYALARMSAASVIYGARIGVEVALLGVPVIVAGETYVRNKGFTYDANSRDEYFELLGRIPSLPKNNPEKLRLAKQWYYYYFFRLMMTFPYFAVDRVQDMSNPRLTFKSLDELAPGRSRVLDIVCQGIADGVTPFEHDEFQPDEPRPADRV